jgi:hypothetical protein
MRRALAELARLRTTRERKTATPTDRGPVGEYVTVTV